VRKPRGNAAICDSLKPKLEVSYLPLAELVPAERNARTHSPEQIQQIARSIGAFGWTNPILVDEGRAIIAGHGRLEAARAAGLAEVPTITLAGLSAAQKRALAIMDNKLALNAGWDDELLRLELGELGLEGFDLGLIGFSDLELKDILDDVIELRNLPPLPNGDRNPFQQMTFTLHDEQVEVVTAALAKAKERGVFAGPNENSNGNALARISESYG
jgi:hypothetical protein